MIAQTLHGYDQGHRLLAQGGEVSERELAILDRLSDLSGYLPLGTEFDRYHTGFPCGRYYAFACTWYDSAAARAGTVLTHTLLVPRPLLPCIADLWSVGALHRRPMSALDRAPYKTALSFDAVPIGSVPRSIDRARAEAAVVLWFGQADRPVLWEEDARPDDVVGFLWGLLWAEARERLAFCTFALQVRYVSGRPFDLLALPASARGSFHERARSQAWWQEGAPASASLRELGKQGWAQEVMARGAEVTAAMQGFCAAQGLPVPDAPMLPVFLRFIELEAASRERLTAARARADLLVRLWPAVAPEHPLLRAVLGALLARQGDAPLAPQPFWELRDMVQRPMTQALWEQDPGFATDVEDVIAREAARRLSVTEGDAVEAFVTWIHAESLPRVRPALLRAVRVWVERTPTDDMPMQKVAALLSAAVGVQHQELVEAVLAPLPPSGRGTLVEVAAAHLSEREISTLSEMLVAAAHQLNDLELAACGWRLRGDTLAGLREATRIALAQPDPPLGTVERLVQATSDADQLAWALDVEGPALAARAAVIGAAAAARTGMPWVELVKRCEGAPNGWAVLLRRAMTLPTYEVRAALRDAGPVAVELVKRAVTESDPAAGILVAAATEVVSDEALLTADLAATIEAAADTMGARRLVDAVLPLLVRRLAAGEDNAGEVGAWLKLRLVQEAIARSSPWGLFNGASQVAAKAAWLPAVAQIIAEQAAVDSPPLSPWIPCLLTRPLEEASAWSLAASQDALVRILDFPLSSEHRGGLAAAILFTVRRTGCRECRPLVERTFPVVYPMLLEDSPWLRPFTWFWEDAWDRAKSWRRWLIESWIAWGWPAEGLLACVGGDETLLRRLVKRAARSWEGAAFLGRLIEAIRRDDGLRERWGRVVAQMIDDSEAGADYE